MGTGTLALPDPGAVASRVAARKRPGASQPPVSQLELFLTEDCCLRCDYCFVGHKRPRYMASATARAAVEFLLSESGRTEQLSITLFGGEPMLCYEVVADVVAYARRRGGEAGKAIAFTMTTNGLLFDDRWGRLCRDEGVTYLLSVDGTREAHDRHRKDAAGRGSFDRVAANIPMMKQYQPWMGARMTVHPDVVTMLADGVEQLQERGINQFIISAATGVTWHPEARTKWLEQMLTVAEHYTLARESGVPVRVSRFERSELSPGRYRGVFGCRAGRNSMSVDVDGGLHGCSKMIPLNQFDPPYRLGDVWSGITDHAARAELTDITSLRRPSCAVCPNADECAGGCPAVNWEAQGSIFAPSPETCALTADFISVRDRFAAILNGCP